MCHEGEIGFGVRLVSRRLKTNRLPFRILMLTLQ